MAMQEELTTKDNVKLHLQELEALDENFAFVYPRCLIALTKAVDLTTNARSFPSSTWITDGRVTSSNDEDV
ncbi:uncharacterized protein E6C27_scaffold345G00470 [Cucumis melo var. makuwa]|uniref:Uncharacterized protein n=1 Tax=Cucumis melo var. makuwa TaxID=1194695 RepID=A0A5A7TD58_CUCMM|nr:uncharacterized protein E6C27_scaffold345G00470 [Cucumis melo var. makuwa]